MKSFKRMASWLASVLGFGCVPDTMRLSARRVQTSVRRKTTGAGTLAAPPVVTGSLASTHAVLRQLSEAIRRSLSVRIKPQLFRVNSTGMGNRISQSSTTVRMIALFFLLTTFLLLTTQAG